MKKIKLLIIALITTVVFASCSDEGPARMLWEVSATPTENVKAVFDSMFYHQIQISSDGEGGEVTLKCTNYKTLQIEGEKNNTDEYTDSHCHFTAKVTEAGIIKIKLEKMPEDFNEVSATLTIVGIDGKHTTYNTVDIMRKP